MNITLKAFAQLGELLGTETKLDVPDGITIPEVLALLCDGADDRYRALFDDTGAVHDYLILVKNRVRVERRDLPSMPLADGDEVALLPPVAGG